MPNSPCRCRAKRGCNPELEAWIDLIGAAFERGEHIDLIVFGDGDDLVSVWSTCPATNDRSAFLSALMETVAEAEAAADVGGKVVH